MDYIKETCQARNLKQKNNLKQFKKKQQTNKHICDLYNGLY